MASLTHCNLILFFHIFLLFIISYPPNTLSQDPTSSSPTIAPCTSNLLPLIPCTPFAQGAVSAPASDCCSNLKQLYGQEPHCICLLLNNTAFTSFPINKTLAIQIPSLCNLQVNNSVCPGEKTHAPPPSSSSSQVSFGTKNNSTVAASPAFSVPPRPSMMGFGFGRSEAINLKAKNGIIVIMNITIFMFILMP
ncbi:non-specific lipid transfer protein GPI-anchored 10 [Lathyrus oleraceus]|uniref:Bifunctional inhibitor/plant lipid transfer protein/seed storage helical domain-containing protein n=1 Tax=Pisum sativum TaxID=3888 RepID=A0A9D5BEG3_PEA|nr:non-specific lipid transfer protein GPI-anchored 10 [Pisum sativum]KAI5441774.1 hypothetical protein KIW84_011005 [Pisum sativum]